MCHLPSLSLFSVLILKSQVWLIDVMDGMLDIFICLLSCIIQGKLSLELNWVCLSHHLHPVHASGCLSAAFAALNCTHPLSENRSAQQHVYLEVKMKFRSLYIFWTNLIFSEERFTKKTFTHYWPIHLD